MAGDIKNYGPSGGGLPDGPIRPFTLAVSERERKRPVEALCGDGGKSPQSDGWLRSERSRDLFARSQSLNGRARSFRRGILSTQTVASNGITARDAPAIASAAAAGFVRAEAKRGFRENGPSVQSLAVRRFPLHDPFYDG